MCSLHSGLHARYRDDKHIHIRCDQLVKQMRELGVVSISITRKKYDVLALYVAEASQTVSERFVIRFVD